MCLFVFFLFVFLEYPILLFPYLEFCFFFGESAFFFYLFLYLEYRKVELFFALILKNILLLVFQKFLDISIPSCKHLPTFKLQMFNTISVLNLCMVIQDAFTHVLGSLFAISFVSGKHPADILQLSNSKCPIPNELYICFM